MKKIRLFTLLSLILSLTLLLLVGCEKEDKISSISLKDHDPDSVIEMAVGAFDYNAYTVVVNYESGKDEEIPLTEQMIDSADVFKFYKEGDHDITISHAGQSYKFKIAVKRSSFASLKFSENNVFTYDGKAHSAELVGDIPANAVINYIGGNSFVNAGTYDVTAVISSDGYVTEKLSTTVTINRAKYDMSGVRFDSKEVVYDGNSHSVEVVGTLPDGVSAPVYSIDGKPGSSAVDVGDYTVKATFTNSNSNYEDVPFMQTTLKITASPYTLPGVDLIFKNEDQSVINGLSKFYDGKGVSYEINDKSIIGKKIFVSYNVTDKDGNPLTDDKGNAISSFKNVGRYTVKMNIVLIDGKNYQEIDPIVYTFEIKKAQYDTSDINLDSSLEVYNGNAHKLLVSLPLGHDVKADEIIYEYILNGKVLDVDPNVGVVDAGEYTVRAIFPDKNANYEKIGDMQAVLRIEKCEIDVSGVGFFGNSKVEYSGDEIAPSFRTLMQATGLDFELFTYSEREYYKLDDSGEYVKITYVPKEVGTYRCMLKAEMDDEHRANYVTDNGNYVLNLQFNFEIYKKEIDVPYVEFLSGVQTTYNGSAQGEYNCNANTEFVSVTPTYFYYSSERYVAMGDGELPTNVGLYKVVVALDIKDTKNVIFVNGQTSVVYTLEFEIVPAVVEGLDKVSIDAAPLTYNGSHQTPKINGLPENAQWNVNIYPLGSQTPITEVINAGDYRLEIIFTAKENYLITSNNKLVFNFKINPLVIDLNGLDFDSTEFVYNGKDQRPSLVGLPLDEVEIYSRTVYYTTLNMLYGDMEVANAIGAGDYRYTFSIRAKTSNCVLEGQSSHSVNFKIRSKELANLDSMITGNYELVWVEGGYTSNALQNAINKALFGNMSYEVAVTLNSVYSVDEGKDVSVAEIKADGIYKISCKLEMWGQADSYHSEIKYYNYQFTHNGLSKPSVMNIEFNFTVVNRT